MNKIEHIKSSNLWEKIRDSWVEYSHAIYVFIVIAGLYLGNIEDTNDFKSKAALVAILCYFIVLLLFLGYFIHAYSRKARYAEAIVCLRHAMSEIEELAEYLKFCYLRKDRYEISFFKESLKCYLDSIARAYTLVTGTHCRVSIKLLGGDSGQELYVKTLCRDSVSSKQSEEKDASEGKKHLIVKNTDYNLILNNGRDFFLNNDIKKDSGYTNTSKEESNGELPYSAAIVVPISCKRYTEVSTQEEGTSTTRDTVLGFVAIDSSARNTFTEKYDVQMAAMAADALYPVLDIWNRVHARHSKRKNK